LNATPFTSVKAERERLVVFEGANVAALAAPLGTVAGVQFVAVFQSPLPGLRFQVALPGYAEPYPFGPHAVVWCILSLAGGVLFFVRPRPGAS
jgi:hypothetical protein